MKRIALTLSLAVALAGLMLAITTRAQEGSNRGSGNDRDWRSGNSQTDGAEIIGGEDAEPTGKGWGRTPTGRASGKAVSVNGMVYHNGPVILGTTHIYYIWYGQWQGNTAVNILTDLAKSIGGSPYFKINTTYYNSSNTHVTNAVTLASPTAPYYADNYSQGAALSDAKVKSVVSTAITSGNLPKDANGVYFVLTSKDVNETSGFCTQYCGWHTHATINSIDIKYAFIGNPDRCPNACSWQTTSPNGNAGADGMASIISHELEESVTDPDLNAWYDRNGQENADKCAWTFGTTYAASGGGIANMKLGSRDYLIQRNWLLANGGSCQKSY